MAPRGDVPGGSTLHSDPGFPAAHRPRGGVIGHRVVPARRQGRQRRAARHGLHRDERGAHRAPGRSWPPGRWCPRALTVPPRSVVAGVPAKVVLRPRTTTSPTSAATPRATRSACPRHARCTPWGPSSPPALKAPSSATACRERPPAVGGGRRPRRRAGAVPRDRRRAESDAPDARSTTGSGESENIVGRVAGQDVGYAGRPARSGSYFTSATRSFNGMIRVVGDVDVLRADLRAALRDVAQAKTHPLAEQLAAVVRVQRVHLQLRVLDERAGPGEVPPCCLRGRG